IKPFLPKRDLLSYVEAILRVYNQFGRRDNIYKARIKILVHDLGAESFAKARAGDRRFATWFNNSVSNHKVPGYAIVTLSLKPEGGPPGDATAEQMDAIADLAEKYSFGEIRVGHEQNLALPHVARRDLPALWKALDKIGVATPNVNLVSDIIACPGL